MAVCGTLGKCLDDEGRPQIKDKYRFNELVHWGHISGFSYCSLEVDSGILLIIWLPVSYCPCIALGDPLW